MTVAERANIIENLHEPSFKGAFLRSLTGLLYVNEIRYGKKQRIFLICKEHYMSIPVVIYARKNFYLLQAINSKINQIQASGLIEHWHSQAVSKRFQTVQKVAKSRETMTLDHLSGCFYLLMMGLLASVAAFVIEIGCSKMP